MELSTVLNLTVTIILFNFVNKALFSLYFIKNVSIFILANDCFVLGLQSFNENDFYHAELWLNEALTRNEKEQSSTTIRWAILEYLANSTFMQGKRCYKILH